MKIEITVKMTFEVVGAEEEGITESEARSTLMARLENDAREGSPFASVGNAAEIQLRDIEDVAFEFWSVLMHEQWEEGIIFGGHTAQEAEDKAEAYIIEDSKEEDHEYRDRNYTITAAAVYHRA